ncbi:MAG: hypothetical protein H6693_10855 [Candidatus Latescibacteria bacterium]|nr:hypothetical protein [Candidatus Latescibacterota bacterium]
MKRNAIAILIIALALPTLAAADDVTDAIDEGLAAYKANRFGDAASSLEYAAALIKQQKGEAIGVVFPDAPAGWSREEPQSGAAGAAMFGGGVSASCDYEQDGGDGQMSIQIMSDSPVIATLSMALSNPMLMASDGAKLTKFGGNKARVKFENGSGEIQVLVESTVLVTLNGSDLPSKEPLTGLAEAIDWDALTKIARDK